MLRTLHNEAQCTSDSTAGSSVCHAECAVAGTNRKSTVVRKWLSSLLVSLRCRDRLGEP